MTEGEHRGPRGHAVPPVTLHLSGEGAFSDVSVKDLIRGTWTDVACLEGGTESGLPSVALRVETEHGVVIAETSMRMFLRLAEGMAARYGRLL